MGLFRNEVKRINDIHLIWYCHVETLQTGIPFQEIRKLRERLQRAQPVFVINALTRELTVKKISGEGMAKGVSYQSIHTASPDYHSLILRAEHRIAFRY